MRSVISGFSKTGILRAVGWLLLGGAALLLFSAPGTARAQSFAIRTDLGISSLEGELFLGKFGLLAILQTSYENSACAGTLARSHYGARYFFQRPKSSWYLGILSYADAATSSNACSLGADLGGTTWMGGYHWVFARNFSVDVGFRPNILMVGLAF